MDTQQLISFWSDKILDFLIQYNRENPEFVFWTRQKNFIKSNVDRFQQHQWFQGSDYINVSPYKKGDSNNKTKSIGFVVTINKESLPVCELELNFGGNENLRIRDFYEKVATSLGTNDLRRNVRYVKRYQGHNVLQLLEEFISNDVPVINRVIDEYNLSNEFYIPPADFKKQIKKTLGKRNEVNNEQQTGSDNEVDYYEGEQKKRIKEHKWKERNRGIIKDFKRKYRQIHICPACKVDLKMRYKIEGIQLLEAHHIIPLSKVKEKVKITFSGLSLLCPTCHRAIHRMMANQPDATITPQDLVNVIERNTP